MIGTFDYAKVRSVEEGCALLSEHHGDATVLAGGTDLLVDIRNGVESPSFLVDVKGINELKRFKSNSQIGLVIGAGVPLNVIVEDETVRLGYQALAESAMSIGSWQIRNRATLAGNLCNASPAADAAPALFVLNAKATIVGPSGTRSLPARDLFVGVKENALNYDEILTTITVPPAFPSIRTKFLKKQRIRGHDLATINMAGYFNSDTGELRVAIGSCAPTPILVPALDEPVQERDSLDELVYRLNELAQGAISPISDLRSSADYRRELIPVFLRRLLQVLLHSQEDEPR